MIATKNCRFKISPDCSGYNVKHSATLFERKAGPKVSTGLNVPLLKDIKKSQLHL